MRNALILSAILMLFMALGWLYQNKKATELKAEVSIWRDAEGRSRAKLEVQEQSFKDVLNINRHKIEFLESEIDGLRKRNINQVTTISIKTVDTVKVTLQADTVYRDTVIYRLPVKHHFTYQDDWTSINGSLSFFTNQVEVSYSTKDSLEIVDHSNKKGTYLDVISHNPNSTITGMTNYRVDKKKKLRASPAIFTGMSNKGPVVGAGVAITFTR